MVGERVRIRRAATELGLSADGLVTMGGYRDGRRHLHYRFPNGYNADAIISKGGASASFELIIFDRNNNAINPLGPALDRAYQNSMEVNEVLRAVARLPNAPAAPRQSSRRLSDTDEGFHEARGTLLIELLGEDEVKRIRRGEL